jgi:hypothetical protein
VARLENRAVFEIPEILARLLEADRYQQRPPLRGPCGVVV